MLRSKFHFTSGNNDCVTRKSPPSSILSEFLFSGTKVSICVGERDSSTRKTIKRIIRSISYWLPFCTDYILPTQ